MIVWPSLGAVSLALVFGIYLLAYGITLRLFAATGTQRPSFGARLGHRSQSTDPKSALDHRRRRPRLKAVGRRRRELTAQRARQLVARADVQLPEHLVEVVGDGVRADE